MHRLVQKIVLGVLATGLASASAHVTVWPRSSSAGAYEKYIVRVPTEGKVATTSVEISIPANATFIAVATAVGHTYELKQADGRVTVIVWTMKIGPNEFAEFSFMARNPKDGNEIVWKATQRFADGSSVEWNGPAGDKHPASITTLSPTAGEHSH